MWPIFGIHSPIQWAILEENWLGNFIINLFNEFKSTTLLYFVTIHYPKYLDQFLMILLATFTTGLVFVCGSKEAYVLTKTAHHPKYLD